MSRDKQIEEMAKDICKFSCLGDCLCCEYEMLPDNDCVDFRIAEGLYNAGYRKSSDVAEEIFAEIEKIINEPFAVGFNLLAPLKQALGDYNNDIRKDLLYYIAELKKKYIGKDTNVPTKMED